MPEHRVNTLMNEKKTVEMSETEQNNAINEVREKGLEIEIRNLGYIDQHINEDQTSWFACSGLEIGLVTEFDSPAKSFVGHVVNFDYELVYDPQYDPSIALRALESAMADEEAKGALACERGSPELRKKRNRGLQTKNSIVTINSAPIDVIDDRVDECTSSITVTGDYACTPYRGSMEFISDCLDCPFSNTEVLASIKEACENGQYLDGDKILQVNYIGLRTDPLIAITEGTPPLKKSSNAGTIAGALVASAAFFSILSFYVLRANRKRDKGKVEDLNVTHDLSEEDDDYIESNHQSYNQSYNQSMIDLPNINAFPAEIDDTSVSSYKEGVEIEIQQF